MSDWDEPPWTSIWDQPSWSEQQRILISGGIKIFRTEERNLSILYNIYITHRIVGYTQIIDLLCTSAKLVRVPHYKTMELNSKPADLVKIKWLPVFTRFPNGIPECYDRSISIYWIEFSLNLCNVIITMKFHRRFAAFEFFVGLVFVVGCTAVGSISK